MRIHDFPLAAAVILAAASVFMLCIDIELTERFRMDADMLDDK